VTATPWPGSAADDGLVVRGGSAGVSATTEAMHATAGHVVQVAEAVAGLVPQALALAAHPALGAAAALDPFGAAQTMGALAEAVGGVNGLGRCAAGSASLGASLYVAAEVYRVAEADAQDLASAAWRQLAPHLLATAVRSAPAAAGPVVLVVSATAGAWVLARSVPVAVDTVGQAVAMVRTGELDPDAAAALWSRMNDRIGEQVGDDVSAVALSAQQVLARNPWLAREIVATLPLAVDAMAPEIVDLVLGVRPVELGGTTLSSVPDSVPELAGALVGAGTAAGLLRQGTVTVTPAGPVRAGRPAVSIGGLLGGLAPYAPARPGEPVREYTPGRVRVDRIDAGSAARPRWVVYLPPTQTWSVRGGRLPADGTSNLAMVAGVDADAVEAAHKALQQAGVAPGDPVLAVGYSQGGLTAATLATDATSRQSYNVTAVLTFGSPVSLFDLPEDVAALSVENTGDLVVEVDGGRNPDRPSWATVEHPLLDPVLGQAQARQRVLSDPWAGHGFDTYTATAQLVDDSQHPSIEEWKEQVGDFLHPPAGAVTTREFLTVRYRE